MIVPGGYILAVSPERSETLLGYAAPNQSVGEPVPSFPLSRRAPLLVFGSFSPGQITHIADGRKGVASGTKMVRLNLTDIQPLAVPITFSDVVDRLPSRLRSSVRRRLQGGLLTTDGFKAIVDVISDLCPDARGRLARFSGRRSEQLSELSERSKDALAGQKESVGLAFRIAGFDTRRTLAWSPVIGAPGASFLDGMPEARMREDAMIAHDLGQFPGFSVIKSYPFAARTFEAEGVKLTIVLANKLPLEEQFGTDLVYYNETFKSFVMVQYKAMERDGEGRAHFRLPNTQLEMEVARMDRALENLRRISDDGHRDSFRLHQSPFFMKLCSRYVFNPDDGGLFPGMYLPLDYWKRASGHDATIGERGGRVVTFDNIGRRLTEAEFVGLVAGAWIGTTIPQSNSVEVIIREILESGKAVTIARQSGRRVGPSLRAL